MSKRRSERLKRKREESDIPKKDENPPKKDENPPKKDENPPKKDEIPLRTPPKKQRTPLNKIFFITEFVTKNTIDNEDSSSSEEKSEEEVLNIFGPFLPTIKQEQIITFSKIFETLDELISLGEKYDPGVEYKCTVDMKKLHRIVEPLKELNSMIGLNKFKKNIIDQLVYILTTDFSASGEIPMLHSCMYGSPGTGKTTVCKILADIYSNCGLLSVGGFKVAKREDFVGEFLGQTALKTKKLLESCKGKVLFIDEVYSFGSSKSNSKDMFAKEAVDTLNVFLSENYKDFICIIAGYEKEVESCFFSINEGLKRRFTNKYTIDGYSPSEMKAIFLKFVVDEKWEIDNPNCLTNFFIEHKESFPYYGGDIKTLLDKCKIVHSRKIIMLDKKLWRTLNKKDIEEGFINYLEERQVKKEEENLSYLHMYL